MTTPEDIWRRLKAAHNLADLAKKLDPPLTRAAVSAWDKVPAERVVEVARLLGLSRADIRPDLYDPWSSL